MFDSSLSLQWSFIYPENIPNPSTSSSLALIEGGFIVAGAINNFGELRVLQYHETFSTSIKNSFNTQSFIHWPNPASDRIFFQLEEPIEKNTLFRLYDVHSRLILEESISLENKNTFNIDIKFLPSDIYFYNILSKNKYFNGKFIKLN